MLMLLHGLEHNALVEQIRILAILNALKMTNLNAEGATSSAKKGIDHALNLSRLSQCFDRKKSLFC